MMIAAPQWLFRPLQSSSIDPETPCFMWLWIWISLVQTEAIKGFLYKYGFARLSALYLQQRKGERQSLFCMQLYRHSQTNTDSYSRTSGHSGNARLSPAAYCWAGLFVCVGWIIDIFRASLYIHVLCWAYLWHCLQLSVTWFKSCSHAANANANFTSLIG